MIQGNTEIKKASVAAYAIHAAAPCAAPMQTGLALGGGFIFRGTKDGSIRRGCSGTGESGGRLSTRRRRPPHAGNGICQNGSKIYWRIWRLKFPQWPKRFLGRGGFRKNV